MVFAGRYFKIPYNNSLFHQERRKFEVKFFEMTKKIKKIKTIHEHMSINRKSSEGVIKI